jgi:hypothetical protein
MPLRRKERHRTERIGWLRAAVLGANDGIISTASLVLGIAAAHGSRSNVLVAGVALQATSLGLKYAFINQPVEVPNIRNELSCYLGLGGRRPDIVVRFGNGPELPKSLRRPPEQPIL